MAMQISPSSFGYTFTYDVFLSFRGEDTRYGFTGNLYNALRNRGIHTFIDDEELQRGDEITPALEKAIEGSRIFIIVLSQNYASSTFCLNELAHILNFIKAKGLLVLPVFHNVDPSDVRHHKGSFGEALAKHRKRLNNNMEKLEAWRLALHQVANLSGYHFTGYEYVFTKEIVELVSSKINRVPLYVADYPVGLESRVVNVKLLLDVGSDDVVHMVGIHGLGGVGKTTLAVAVYNSIADYFEALCFLENVRETSDKLGLQHLQSTLLSETVGEKEIKLTSVKQGISIIQHRLQQKKVLLILDDVDQKEQLEAIVGRPNWFGPGSRIIITTRDKQLLACHGVKRSYGLEELNDEEACQLLCWKAFKMEKVDEHYEDVLNRAVTYASGLPLALEVIGSNLFGKSIEQWESSLNRYERSPDKKIQDTLKISYDALEEEEQSVFLDIACCFKEFKLEEVEDLLHAHYSHCVKHHIGKLVDKSLIKICWDRVRLHDLIAEMGKEIVQKESPKEPGKRSRLWFLPDIVQVLEENKGTSRIEIIYTDFPLYVKEFEVNWDGEAFKKMKNLKTLIVRNGRFSKGPKHLPNTLRVLEWWSYPSKNLPFDFHPKKLAICKLPDSGFASLELASLLLQKRFLNLTCLNFDTCERLTKIPDLSSLSRLEKLSFEFCKNLHTIHHSIGFLEKLQILCASGCSNLKSFPPIKLTSLEQLKLQFCESLETFPEILGRMENITQLNLYGTSIKKFPVSFRNLTRLQELRLEAQRGQSINTFDAAIFIWNISMMPELAKISAFQCNWWRLPEDDGEGAEKVISTVSSNIQCLQLTQCYLSDEFFLLVRQWFANVKELDLSMNNFKVIPECIKECHFLTRLILDDCFSLEEIKGIPPNLKYFSAKRCPLTSSCRSMLLNQDLHEAGNTIFYVSGNETPKWFECQTSSGSSISFWFRNKLPAIAIFIVMEPFYLLLKYMYYGTVVINDNRHYMDTWEMPIDSTCIWDLQEMILQDNLDEDLLKNEWNHGEVICEDQFNDPNCVAMGIHVLKKQGNMEDIRFTDPCRKEK